MGKKRNNSVSDAQIIETYSGCLSAYKTASALGVGETTVYRVLLTHGIERPGLEHYRKNAGTFNVEQCEAMRVEYDAGAELVDLVNKYGGNHGSVKSAIRRAGGQIRPAPNSVLSSEEIDAIRMLKVSGMGQMAISVALKRSQSVVSRAMREHGIPTGWKQSGPDHPMWKGGEWLTGPGYVRVIVAMDDPMAVMRDSSGYVLKHRLVMARFLNRPLTSHETVHHINGDKLDNRLENLQLRQGKHGKGSVFRCLDCGSSNIEATEIAE